MKTFLIKFSKFQILLKLQILILKWYIILIENISPLYKHMVILIKITTSMNVQFSKDNQPQIFQGMIQGWISKQNRDSNLEEL